MRNRIAAAIIGIILLAGCTASAAEATGRIPRLPWHCHYSPVHPSLGTLFHSKELHCDRIWR